MSDTNNTHPGAVKDPESLDDVNLEEQPKESAELSTQARPTDTLSFWSCVMMLTTFNTSGSIVLMPSAFGTLGYIGGTLACLLWAALALMTSFFICDVALATKERLRSLGEAGLALAGVRGCRLFQFFQLLNLVLYMPVALDTIALSVQYLSNYALGHCIGYWNIIIFAGLLFAQQFITHWHHVAWVTYFTVALACAKAFALLPYAYVTYEGEVKASDAYLGPVQAFGAPGNTWFDVALAVSTFPYTFTPIFILIEVMGEMKDPKPIKRALSWASGFQLTFYLVAGLTGVALWGYGVEDPVTLEIPRQGWVGLTLSASVAIAVFVDYLIASKIVSDAFATVKCVSGHVRDPESWKSQLIVTVPPSLFSLLLVCAVPNLSTLVGVVTGFAVLGMNTWVITLAWELGKRVIHADKSYLHIATFVGVPLTLWVIVAAFYEIATADYEVGHFFCTGY